jgi:hypothetical protein
VGAGAFHLDQRGQLSFSARPTAVVGGILAATILLVVLTQQGRGTSVATLAPAGLVLLESLVVSTVVTCVATRIRAGDNPHGRQRARRPRDARQVFRCTGEVSVDH